MRRSNFQQLGQAIDDFFKKSGFDQKIKEIELKENWKILVGPVFAKSTQKITFYNGVLFVTLDSAAIKNELLLNRSILIEKLNESVHKKMVHEIIIK